MMHIHFNRDIMRGWKLCLNERNFILYLSQIAQELETGLVKEMKQELRRLCSGFMCSILQQTLKILTRTHKHCCKF